MKILITGGCGYVGSVLIPKLLNDGHKITSVDTKWFGDYLPKHKRLKNIKSDISNFNKITFYIKKIKPDYIFNLAGISSLTDAFNNPIVTNEINNSSVLNMLEAIKKFSKKTKFFQASSSELFSENKLKKVSEQSIFKPRSPYAIAKLSAHYYCDFYRSFYKLYVVNGILFNHESPLRKEQFFTKKIVKGLILYKLKKNKGVIQIGNIRSKKDWGVAEDFVKVIYKSMTLKKPTDFIFCTGIKKTVKFFIDSVAKNLNIKLNWIKKNNRVFAVDRLTKKKIIESNESFFRNDKLYNFSANNNKAKKMLNWKPDLNIDRLIKKMIKFEMDKYDNIQL